MNASVAMKGAMALPETRYPTTEPPIMATRIAIIRAMASGRFNVERARTTLDRAKTDPTERSIPAVRITSSIPRLAIEAPET